jgi:hypothetical protein
MMIASSVPVNWSHNEMSRPVAVGGMVEVTNIVRQAADPSRAHPAVSRSGRLMAGSRR